MIKKIAVFAVVLFTCFISSICVAHSRHVINLPKPNLPFSDGIVVGNTLYIAGEDGILANGKLVAGGIVPETQVALSKIRRIVHEAGFHMNQVVSTTVYLSNLADYPKMNSVYRHYFSKPYPTRASVQVVRLVGNAHVEISAVAVR